MTTTNHISCTKCGTQNQSDNRFCSNCGTTLNISATANTNATQSEKPKNRRGCLILIGVLLLLGFCRAVTNPTSDTASTSVVQAPTNTVVLSVTPEETGIVSSTEPQETSTVDIPSWQQRPDLDVSRDSVERAFQELGTRFEATSNLHDGTPRVLGRLGATTVVELQGPRDRLLAASVTAFANAAVLADDVERQRIAAAFIVLPRQCLRDWKTSDTWINNSMNEAAAAFNRGEEYNQVKRFNDGSWIKFEVGDASALIGSGGLVMTLSIGRDQ